MEYIIGILLLGFVLFIIFRLRARRDFTWSKGKGITAFNDGPLGYHFVFVDQALQVAMFLPRTNGTVTALLGDPTKAHYFVEFDVGGNATKSGDVSPGACQWMIGPKGVRYRGTFFPRQGPPHRAQIRRVDDFHERMMEKDFLDRQARRLLYHMHVVGELPMRALNEDAPGRLNVQDTGENSAAR